MKLRDVPRSKLNARARAFIDHLEARGWGNVEVSVRGNEVQVSREGLPPAAREAIQNEAAAFRQANPPGEPIRAVPRETAVAQAVPAAPAQALTAGIQRGALSPPQAYAPGSRLSQMRDVADQGALSPPAPGTSFTPGPPSPMGMAPSDFGGIATPPAGFTASDYGMRTGPAPAALAPSAAISSPTSVQLQKPDQDALTAPTGSLMGPGLTGPALGPQTLGGVPEGGLLAGNININGLGASLQPAPVDPSQTMAPAYEIAPEMAPAYENPPTNIVTPEVATPQPVQQAQAAPAAEAYPTPSLAPSDIYGGAIGTAAATGGNFVSRDPYGTTSVTNQYGATTGMTPGGYQTAYGGTPGGDIGGSLFGGGGDAQGYRGFDALGNPMSDMSASKLGSIARNIGKRAIGLDPNRSFAAQKNEFFGRTLGALGGGAFAGPAGALGGGLFGGYMGAQRDFPDRPSGGVSQGVPGGARTERERSDISPAASRSISRGDRVSGLW